MTTDAKKLIIVESPTKANTITKIMGDGFQVVPSLGHLVDLPEKELGVDISAGFKPKYVVIAGRQKVVKTLKQAAKDKECIYIATDPDREGEAIGWHLKERIFPKLPVKRVIFHEITPASVRQAFQNPRDFDVAMVEAQISRRILDRIVGYFLSPLLWKKIGRGLSAGRVQSVALRLIVEREEEINSFVPKEYWEIEARLRKKGAPEKETFLAKLEKIDSQKVSISTKEEAETLCADIRQQEFRVAQVKKVQKKRNPEPPFITSSLQQEAFNKLGFHATKTMIVAQQLYEGIDIGQAGPVGLITYMRTDSYHVANEAIEEGRHYIKQQFGEEYLPAAPHKYKTKKLAQEAHEAIRPTMIDRSPQSLKPYLTNDQYKLYELIYNRFLASQMASAIYEVTTIEINAGRYLFVASGSSLVFAGFTVLYNSAQDKEKNKKEKHATDAENKIPLGLNSADILDLCALLPSQHFTRPPARYSDSSLVKTMEEYGIGRPSTYAPIIQTLLARNYVRRIKGVFYPTELGVKTCKLLMEYFPKIMDVKFTALMEEKLDQIEEGHQDKLKVLSDFYFPFKESLDFALKHIPKEVISTDEVCEECGRPMVIKWGRKGRFLSCSGYPQCRYSRSINTNVKCPEPGCGGYLVERRGRHGFFYGCSNYPRCKFTSRTLMQTEATAKDKKES